MNPRTKQICSCVLIVIFLTIFIWSGCKLLNYVKECKESVESYENAQSVVQIETLPIIETKEEDDDIDNETTEPLITEPYDEYKYLKIKIDVDWSSLLSQSQDVVGWLYIPDSNMNYPLMHRDNLYYLDHDYLGNYNSGGAVFLDEYVDMNSKNIIIYGHHMSSDTMFHRLVDYADQEYADAHKYIYIATENGTRLYEVFSVVYADSSSDTYTWEFDSGSGLTFKDYINKAIKNSIVERETMEILEGDRIISLSTCSGRSNTERLVVHAVLLTTY